jgi:uncharacterized lipoprotein YmbA
VSAAASARVALATLAMLATAACLGVRPSPDTRHHVLHPVIEAPAGGNPSADVLNRVGVGPTSVPAYLDRPQLVVRTAPDRIEISEFAQWGEPLREGVARVVAVNLSRLLPESLVVTFPWRGADTVEYQVLLDVTQLDGAPGDGVVLDARWRVLDASRRELALGTLRAHEPAEGPGPGALPPAMSRALGTLSRAIAEDLRALGGWRR